MYKGSRRLTPDELDEIVSRGQVNESKGRDIFRKIEDIFKKLSYWVVDYSDYRFDLRKPSNRILKKQVILLFNTIHSVKLSKPKTGELVRGTFYYRDPFLNLNGDYKSVTINFTFYSHEGSKITVAIRSKKFMGSGETKITNSTETFEYFSRTPGLRKYRNILLGEGLMGIKTK